MDAAVTDNPPWALGQAVISVLIPFFYYDPTPLLAALEREGAGLDGRVEVVLLDDGGGDDALAESVRIAVTAATMPARFVRLAKNVGRAQGRNRLAREARGRWLLFLDSDMLPDSPTFLAAYLALIEKDASAVAFGGFSLLQTPPRREHALHRRMAAHSDCAPVAVRRREPEKHVFTSNLLVRRDVFDAEAFDDGFSGWGWEDVEWAMRVQARHSIVHIDNTATHLGLDPAAAMAAKYEQSAANFARVCALHPDIVSRYPSHRVARMLKPLPLRGAWRPCLKGLALAEAAPLALRELAMRLYRASLYAEVV